MIGDIGVEVNDKRTITIPATADAVGTEQAGKALVDAGQNGYSILSIVPIQRDVGNQRDPMVVTLGVKVVLSK